MKFKAFFIKMKHSFVLLFKYKDMTEIKIKNFDGMLPSTVRMSQLEFINFKITYKYILIKSLSLANSLHNVRHS